MQAEPDASPSPDSQAPPRLPAVLDLAAAQALLDTIRTQAAAGAPVLDGRDVERASVPCLQILAAARREAAGLRIVCASDALAAAVDDLGLSAAIPLER